MTMEETMMERFNALERKIFTMEINEKEMKHEMESLRKENFILSGEAHDNYMSSMGTKTVPIINTVDEKEKAHMERKPRSEAPQEEYNENEQNVFKEQEYYEENKKSTMTSGRIPTSSRMAYTEERPRSKGQYEKEDKGYKEDMSEEECQWKRYGPPFDNMEGGYDFKNMTRGAGSQEPSRKTSRASSKSRNEGHGNLKVLPPASLNSIVNYRNWQKQMSMYITYKGLFYVLDEQGLENTQDDNVVMLLLYSYMGDKMKTVVESEVTAYDIWQRLQSYYEGERHTAIAAVEREYDDFKMHPGWSIELYTMKFTKMISDMKHFGIDKSRNSQNNKILNGLRVLKVELQCDSYEVFLEYHSNMAMEITPETMINKLRSKSVQMNHWDKPVVRKHGSQYGLHAGVDTGGGRGRGRGRDGGRGRGRGRDGGRGRGGRGRGRGRDGGRGYKKKLCFRCWEEVDDDTHTQRTCTSAVVKCPDKYKHLQQYCYVALNENIQNGDDEDWADEPAFMTFINDNDDACDVEIEVTDTKGIQVANEDIGIDTCCSRYLLNDRRFFHTLKELQPLSLQTANGAVTTRMGGPATLPISNVDGSMTLVHIKEAYLNEKQALNLLPLIKFHRDTATYGETNAYGGTIFTEDGKMLFSYKNKFNIGMASSVDLNFNMMTIHDRLWHCRMGHVNDKILKKMKEEKSAKDFGYNPTEMIYCEMCPKGKQAASKYNKKKQVKPNGMSADMCGPFRKQSIQGNNYYSIAVTTDEKFTLGKGLAKKSAFPNFIQQCMTILKTQYGKSIKTIKVDGETALKISWFQDFIVQAGIIMVSNIPGAHQQNPLAERMHRTIMESARCMLFTAKLPQSFWEYAANYAVHIYNRRVSQSSNSSGTPIGHLTGKQPSLDHIKIFGSHCQAKVTGTRDKIGEQSISGRMVGIVSDSLDTNPVGYLIVDENYKLHKSRDVIFNEKVVMKNITEIADQFTEEITCETDDNEEVETDNITEETAVETDNNRTEEGVYSRTRSLGLSTAMLTICSLFNMTSPLFAQAIVFTIFDKDPPNYDAAMKSDNWREWKEALGKERSAFEKADTYDIVDPPKGVNIIPSTTIFKTKQDSSGNIDKRKVRACARGDRTIFGIDYEETFAPVAKFGTIRLIIAIATIMRWMILQGDVNSAYLYGILDVDKPVYMRIPKGFYETERIAGKVLRLKKALYGLKNAGKCWFKVLYDFMIQEGFKSCFYDRCCFVRHQDGKVVIICVYVDDLIMTGDDTTQIEEFKVIFSKRFEITDQGELQYIVGLQVERTATSTFLHQSLYIADLLDRSGFEDGKTNRSPLPAKTVTYKNEENDAADATLYRSKVGQLMYAMLGTRPDMAFAISQLAKQMQSPSTEHMKLVDYAIRYIKGTKNHGITYSYESENNVDERRAAVVIKAYSDSDYAGDKADAKSQTGYIISLANGPILWKSGKQSTVALSSAEAELNAAMDCSTDIVWCRNMLDFMGFPQSSPTHLYMDNTSAIQIAKNGNATKRSRHFNVKSFYVHEQITLENVIPVYMKTDVLPADMLTKALPGPQLRKHKDMMKVGSKSTSD